VSVIGELASISNERRIKTLDVSDIVLIKQNSPPTPKILKISQISEDYEGEYIEFSGVVISTSGNTFSVQEDDNIQVVIRDSTGIIKLKMRRGDKVQISGILSQYQDHYRLLPIYQDGVKILTSGVLPDTGSDPVNNLRMNEPWRLKLNQPMRRKRLVATLARN
jgi:RNase P/RNase MRP subunit p29